MRQEDFGGRAIGWFCVWKVILVSVYLQKDSNYLPSKLRNKEMVQRPKSNNHCSSGTFFTSVTTALVAFIHNTF